MQSLGGQLLVASTDLHDPNFFQAVVLVVQHHADGALGVILNRPTTTKLRMIWSQVSDSPCNSDAVLCAGGPIQGPLMAIHANDALAESEILPGVMITSNRDHITSLVDDDVHPLRLFAGYAGWGGGQLERELAEGSWLVVPATEQHVFQPERDLWKHLLKQINGAQMLAALKIKHVPSDPRAN